eukprot:CAMPEP_0172829778 /NCGR_PEP_ID=MMETSP1075-20121228/21762_1 /TAXON_ID=2916 /ORGANISM="Ceratium fusus, Strain PA161109" /LENGTH=134 /DNA_ID=CAMNT_0013671961 /DNA_START=292 /DNA_END=697 /DNA_ORIENTATION=+
MKTVTGKMALVLAPWMVTALVSYYPITISNSIGVLSHICGPVWECQRALTMLLALLPLALISRAICESAEALTVGHVCNPRTHIDATIWVLESPKTMCLTGPKLATDVPPSLNVWVPDPSGLSASHWPLYIVPV